MPETPNKSCCSLEAIVTVDERGQILLPKELRRRVGIAPGDRLAAVVYRGDDGTLCCITLAKTDSLASAVTSLIEPVVRSAGSRKAE